MTLGAFGLMNCLSLSGKKKYIRAAGRSAEKLKEILHERPINESYPVRGRYGHVRTVEIRQRHGQQDAGLPSPTTANTKRYFRDSE